MEIEKILIIPAFVLITFYAFMAIQSRRSSTKNEFNNIIIFEKPSINWNTYWIGIVFLPIFLISIYKGINNYIANYFFLFYLISLLLDIAFQFIINPDRLYYNEEEVLFFGNFKLKLETGFIHTIKLNGLTNIITIKGRSKWHIAFNSRKIKERQLIELINHIKKANPHLSISDNLIHLT